jgi:hypothetical protein
MEAAAPPPPGPGQPGYDPQAQSRRKRDLLTDNLWTIIGLICFCMSLAGVLRHPRTQRWLKHALMGAEEVEARLARRAALAEEDAQYKDTAMITLATGDAAAKHAVVLLQAMRDYGTAIPNLVVLLSRGGMGSEDCHNETLRNQRNRHYHCSSKYVVEDDIVSQKYLDAFARLGAAVRVIDEIPNSKYTTLIPGGRATFWGMSFNKMRIFDMVEFRKILFIDADVLLLKNIDHIMLEPDFTAAFTTECCNGGARGKLGGGMWIFEPSHARWNYTMDLIQSPCPDQDYGVRLARAPPGCVPHHLPPASPSPPPPPPRTHLHAHNSYRAHTADLGARGHGRGELHVLRHSRGAEL